MVPKENSLGNNCHDDISAACGNHTAMSLEELLYVTRPVEWCGFRRWEMLGCGEMTLIVVNEKCFESMNRQVRLRPFAAEVLCQDANFSTSGSS